jgi:hypothetical protein
MSILEESINTMPSLGLGDLGGHPENDTAGSITPDNSAGHTKGQTPSSTTNYQHGGSLFNAALESRTWRAITSGSRRTRLRPKPRFVLPLSIATRDDQLTVDHAFQR